MARPARIVIPGFVHHITHRGNGGKDIFFDEADRNMYLASAAYIAAKRKVRFVGWVLMTNHVHLLIIPSDEKGLPAFVREQHGTYARRTNAKTGSRDHLFGARYYSCPLDDAGGLEALRYVELNPVRARMVKHAEQHPYSSARAHVAGLADPLVASRWGLVDQVGDHASWLREMLPDASIRFERIRQFTRRGKLLRWDAPGDEE